MSYQMQLKKIMENLSDNHSEILEVSREMRGQVEGNYYDVNEVKDTGYALLSLLSLQSKSLRFGTYQIEKIKEMLPYV